MHLGAQHAQQAAGGTLLLKALISALLLFQWPLHI
jgi:hypothetical protein